MKALSRPALLVAAAVALVVILALVWFAVSEFPAPTQRIEKVVPNDRLPR
jgi:hypothetical protein